MLRLIKELLLLIPGATFAGIAIATIQHYVVFGAAGGGFSRDALGLALFEGGILGGVFGIPTGLATYYLALRRRVTLRRVGVVLSGSLVLGCLIAVTGVGIMGDAFIPFSVLITPLLTIAIGVVADDYCPT
jgi:hypothetical protein